MKTAEELFDKYKTFPAGRNDALDIMDFEDALKEHDAEIKELIDERVKQLHAEIRNHPDRKKGLACKLSEIERFKKKFENK